MCRPTRLTIQYVSGQTAGHRLLWHQPKWDRGFMGVVWVQLLIHHAVHLIKTTIISWTPYAQYCAPIHNATSVDILMGQGGSVG